MTPAVESTYLSTLEAAAALGVSVSTVKRWVDEGCLPAHRTAGGHRKLLRADVLALARSGVVPSQDLAALLPVNDHRGSVQAESVAAALEAVLLAGRAAEVRALLRRAYRGGLPLAQLADVVISPVMRKIGHQWEAEKIDVWHEHRASQLCLAALHELAAEIGQSAEKNRPVAVGASPAGDPYQLSSVLAQLVLSEAGWNAINLGPNMPLANLALAAKQLRPKLIWLSASYLADRERFLREYRAFYRQAQQLSAAVAVGGPALSDAVRSQMPYTTYGDGLTHLAAFAQSLHPRSTRPRRGRPRKP